MGTDKALLPLENTTFVEHAVDVLSAVFSDVIIAGGSAEVSRIASVPVVPDVLEDGGPLAGLISAFEYESDKSIFLLATDMPHVTATQVRAVADPAVTGVHARIAVAAGRDQPLCGTYGRGCFSKAMYGTASGDLSMHAFLGRIGNVERVHIDTTGDLTNVNTPADYEALTGESQ
ncbi:putative molybdenum cofactor guanylyltransferase [bacterium BMS3Bbin02]|nr:putative molybdenum cofactor guanylyltransferase [bacterium BMS3Bbin02]HDH24640.1 molybdenum cofactor guanylyltransferase [Actinomycetota bacterium]